jgi:rubrerythrin
MTEIREFNSVDDILDFAINREQEAVDFYTEAAASVDKEWMKKVFLGFAKEEKGHKAKLQAVQRGKKILMPDKEVQNLKIADYLAAVDVTPNMGYQQVLIVAMNREKMAFKLYSDLAEKVDEAEVRDLFRGLAQEEAKHKLRFELEYDEVILKDN